MRYEDFWFNYDLREFWNAIDGFVESDNTRVQERWEQTRWLGSVIASQPVYGYKHRPIAPKKILPLPWDEKEVKIDQEVIDKMKQEMREHNEKIKKWEPEQ